jgi:cyclase
MYPKWEELVPDVYAYIQKGLGRSNVGVIVRERDVVLVDTLLNKKMIDGLIEQLAKVTDKPVRLIINTHYHTDHVCTNHFFPQATSIASAGCREQMQIKGKTELENDKQMFPDEDWRAQSSPHRM